MYEKIDEPIEVLVNFTFGGPIPLYFTWRKREYNIESVNFIHTSNEGNIPLVHFAVSTQTETYKIIFNTKDLTWTLDEIYTGGFIKNSELHDVHFIKYNFTKAQRLR